MLAAATGRSSNARNNWRHPAGNDRSSCSCTIDAGMAGAASCSRTSASRYGPTSWSGSAASIADIAWPTFIAPPLSCPSVANSCSAVRCCTCAATTSAGRPPIRLPSPTAERPRCAAGTAASRATRPSRPRGGRPLSGGPAST